MDLALPGLGGQAVRVRPAHDRDPGALATDPGNPVAVLQREGFTDPHARFRQDCPQEPISQVTSPFHECWVVGGLGILEGVDRGRRQNRNGPCGRRGFGWRRASAALAG